MLLDTPFGKASKKKVLKRNMTSYIVNDKEFIFVGKALNQQILAEFRKDDGWYDLKHVRILHMLFPEIFAPECVNVSETYFMHKHPDIYEFLKSTETNHLIVFPSKHTSEEAHRRRWYEVHKRDFIEIAAWTDTDENVKQGHVLIKAAVGGDESNFMEYFLVPEHEYKDAHDGYGFICNPTVHERRDIE